MTRQIILHGKTVFETIRDDLKPLKLTFEDMQYLIDHNIDYICVIDKLGQYTYKIITSTYEEGNKLFLNYLGPRQVIYAMK